MQLNKTLAVLFVVLLTVLMIASIILFQTLMHILLQEPITHMPTLPSHQIRRCKPTSDRCNVGLTEPSDSHRPSRRQMCNMIITVTAPNGNNETLGPSLPTYRYNLYYIYA